MEEDVKTPPHSTEAERGVLGSILLDAEAGEDTRVLDLCHKVLICFFVVHIPFDFKRAFGYCLHCDTSHERILFLQSVHLLNGPKTL